MASPASPAGDGHRGHTSLSESAAARASKRVSKRQAEAFQRRLLDAELWEAFDCLGHAEAGSFACLASRGATEVHFQPSDVLMRSGEPCVSGTAPFYILLEGCAIVETDLGVHINVHHAGEIIGSSGALGLLGAQETLRVAGNEPCVCAQLDNEMLQHAMRSHPDAKVVLENHFQSRQIANADVYRERESWIRETVVPALSSTPLFAGCPEDILFEIAQPLCEVTFDPGDLLTEAGEPADSMLVLLEGDAQVLAITGEALGQFSAGASFGDAAALGLFNTRTVTIQALSKCRILSITAEALKRVKQVREAFAVLVQSRRDQVHRGLPLAALPIGVRAEDGGVCAIAMQAERLMLAPGEVWEPARYSDPCGPHFGVLANGRAQMEMRVDATFVMQLGAGFLLPEGLVAEYEARVRAISKCDAYRFSEVDFFAAVALAPSSKDWIYRFRLLEMETRKRLVSRLRNVRATERTSAPHPCDSGILKWKLRRQIALEKARLIKLEKADVVPLPPISPLRAPTHEEHHGVYVKDGGRRYAGRLQKSASEPTVSKKAVSSPKALIASPSLPRICDAAVPRRVLALPSPARKRRS